MRWFSTMVSRFRELTYLFLWCALRSEAWDSLGSGVSDEVSNGVRDGATSGMMNSIGSDMDEMGERC